MPQVYPMHAITIYPVWAWAIVHGHKTVENRTWRTRHRGPLLIHASAVSPASRIADAAARQQLAALGVEVPAEVPAAAIIGQVDVLDCVPYDQPGAIKAAAEALVNLVFPPPVYREQLSADPLASGPFCWILARPRAFSRPIAASGRQRLWRFTL